MGDEPIVFLAAFPDIQSAIKVNGGGNGARITLDIPETELPAIARLLLMRGRVLRITVEAQAGASNDSTPTQGRSRRGRRPTDLADLEETDA